MARTEPPRTGRLARGTITGIAAARIGMAQLGHRVRTPSAQAQADHEAALGRILFGALGQLRGSALKVSQLLSMHPGLLPDGVRQELARAHHQAPPLNRALVGRVFRQAFGQEPEALFLRFEPRAFAAASLGQVHRAELAGHGAVAVKVQYPGIASTIASDMRLLRTTLRAGRTPALCTELSPLPMPSTTRPGAISASVAAPGVSPTPSQAHSGPSTASSSVSSSRTDTGTLAERRV